MDILVLLGGLQLLLMYAVISSAKSYFERGRIRGMQEATREFTRGISAHYELEGQSEGKGSPERVAAAIKAISAITPKKRKRGNGATDPYHAQLWVLGDVIGEACWLKGHTAGMRRKAPAEGKVRVDFSRTELLHLSWLAQLGFQHMMPNYRGFEIHRFSGEADAREGALAVSKIEGAIPARDRPFTDLTAQLKQRQRMIAEWWQAPGRLTA